MAGRSADRDAHRATEAARPVSALRRFAVASLLLLAVLNLALGIATATESARTFDFVQVIDWSATWLRGENPYAPPFSLTDYPPSALLLVAPLAALPFQTALVMWVAINAALAAIVGWLSARFAATGTAAAMLACGVIALPPFRTLNQLSIAAFAPALAGVVLARRHPMLAGIAIGVSLIKPHIGGPALLWAMASRRWQTVAAAAGTQVALCGLYLARTTAPLSVPSEYLQAIARAQNRGDLIPGETNLQPLLSWLSLTPVAVQVLLAVMLSGGLVLIWRRAGRDVDLRFFAAACLLSLLSFRHLSYNLLLAIPALMWAVSHERRGIRLAGVIAFLALAASPPTLWRYFMEPAGGSAALGVVAAHAYRVVLAALFVLVVATPAPQRV